MKIPAFGSANAVGRTAGSAKRKAPISAFRKKKPYDWMGKILEGDCLEVMRGMEPECVDMVVTSPPYWGLRDYGIPGQLGLEKTPEEYIEKLVAIFREVRRVLRPWGTVWLNLGDSYAGSGMGWCKKDQESRRWLTKSQRHKPPGYIPSSRNNLKPKDLCMMPARVALALQAPWRQCLNCKTEHHTTRWGTVRDSCGSIHFICPDCLKPAPHKITEGGWWLRSDIIWAKPNPMPESVTDRPSSSYEHVFLLTKSAKYFYDAEAVRIPVEASTLQRYKTGWNGEAVRGHPTGRQNNFDKYMGTEKAMARAAGGRNLRNVWQINTQPYPEAHYATFPEELPRRCILAGTSAKGCCAECGKPWVRAVEKKAYGREGWGPARKDHTGDGGVRGAQSMIRDGDGCAGWVETKTKGWHPSCNCSADTVPAVVLDPFFGSGTVGVVAEKLQRDWIGIEISREYIEKQAKKRTGLSTSEELVDGKGLFA